MFHRLSLMLGLGGLIFLGHPGEQAGAAEDGAGHRICSQAANRAGAADGLPAGLLQAISVAESGRWDPSLGASFAWPWTVTSGGKGKFFPTKSAAIAHVRQLKRDGVRNIDVGCMQINLMYHPDAFADLEVALDPAANARYAARLMVTLKQKTQSWQGAIGRYHSATPARAGPYLSKVTRLWLGERQIRINQTNNMLDEQALARRAAAEQATIARREVAEQYRSAVIEQFLSRRAERAVAAKDRS